MWLDDFGLVWIRWGSPRHHTCLGVWLLILEREPLRRAWLHLVRWGSDVY